MNRAREIWDERCAGCHSLAAAAARRAPTSRATTRGPGSAGFSTNPDGPALHGPGEARQGDATRRRHTRGAGRADRIRLRRDGRDGRRTLPRSRAAGDLLSPKDCDACHDFDGESENDGPNLKGRGTHKWLAGVIKDAGHPLLFGDRNKMPKFKNKLTEAEIHDLARFVMSQKDSRQ